MEIPTEEGEEMDEFREQLVLVSLMCGCEPDDGISLAVLDSVLEDIEASKDN